jgi:two-component system, cell cycle response regulator
MKCLADWSMMQDFKSTIPSLDLSRASATTEDSNKLAQKKLEQLARTVGDLVDKATQNERILRKFQQFELQLLAITGMEALFDTLLAETLRHFRLDAVELWLFDPERILRDLLPNDVQGSAGLYWFDNDRDLRALYSASQSVHLTSPPPAGLFPGRPMRSAALLPLVRQGALIGSLHFGAFAAQRFSSDKSTDFIGHLASVVAVCIENCTNQERLHRLSLIDMLTRVENRRAFHISIDTEIARAIRRTEPLTVMMGDLDHFKAVNDNHGHQVGDRVLRAVAQEIAGMLRKTDHVCRYGGEEFALILPNCDRGLALEIAERIRARIASLRVASDSGIEVPTSISLGVTCWTHPKPKGIDIAEGLIKVADDAAYRAKLNGRNRVEYQTFG